MITFTSGFLQWVKPIMGEWIGRAFPKMKMNSITTSSWDFSFGNPPPPPPPQNIRGLAKKKFKMYLEGTWSFPSSKGKVIWKVNCPLKLSDFKNISCDTKKKYPSNIIGKKVQFFF